MTASPFPSLHLNQECYRGAVETVLGARLAENEPFTSDKSPSDHPSVVQLLRTAHNLLVDQHVSRVAGNDLKSRGEGKAKAPGQALWASKSEAAWGGVDAGELQGDRILSAMHLVRP